jgi:hypothetical protein
LLALRSNAQLNPLPLANRDGPDSILFHLRGLYRIGK